MTSSKNSELREADEALRVNRIATMQPRLNIGPIAEVIARLIVNRQDDQRLKWFSDDRVRILVGKTLPTSSSVTQPLAERRKQFRAAVKERLAQECWEEVGLHVYKRMATKHKQVRVRVGEFEADVDEELAPLIEQMARAGIRTIMAGQENRPGIAWIMFSDESDLCGFLNIVAEYDPEEGGLYRRASLCDDEGKWEYSVLPHDLSLEEEVTEDDFIEESHDGQVCFTFMPSVRFPRTDLPILLDRMVRHNRDHEAEEMFLEDLRNLDVETE